jgi:hypothetical protein
MPSSFCSLLFIFSKIAHHETTNLRFSTALTGSCVFPKAQQNQSLYSYFDRSIGLKNLGINNGPIHQNPFRVSDQSHRYLGNGGYLLGNVIYDGQPYVQNLKYDIFKDVLVAKINDQTICSEST